MLEKLQKVFYILSNWCYYIISGYTERFDKNRVLRDGILSES